jgi:hypothetical protein
MEKLLLDNELVREPFYLPCLRRAVDTAPPTFHVDISRAKRILRFRMVVLVDAARNEPGNSAFPYEYEIHCRSWCCCCCCCCVLMRVAQAAGSWRRVVSHDGRQSRSRFPTTLLLQTISITRVSSAQYQLNQVSRRPDKRLYDDRETRSFFFLTHLGLHLANHVRLCAAES